MNGFWDFIDFMNESFDGIALNVYFFQRKQDSKCQKTNAKQNHNGFCGNHIVLRIEIQQPENSKNNGQYHLDSVANQVQENYFFSI